MTVTVRYFAIFRERMGQSSARVALDAGATIAGLWEQVMAARPDLRELQAATRFAVNGAYAPPETPLHDGDEVAFLPPMSGGRE